MDLPGHCAGLWRLMMSGDCLGSVLAGSPSVFWCPLRAQGAGHYLPAFGLAVVAELVDAQR